MACSSNYYLALTALALTLNTSTAQAMNASCTTPTASTTKQPESKAATTDMADNSAGIEVITPGAAARELDEKESKAARTWSDHDTKLAESGVLITAFQSDTNALVRMAFSTEDQYLATQATNGVINFWNWKHLLQKGHNKGTYLSIENILPNPTHNQWILVDHFGDTKSCALIHTSTNNIIGIIYPNQNPAGITWASKANHCSLFVLPHYLITASCNGWCSIYDKNTLRYINSINAYKKGNFIALGATSIGVYLPADKILKTYEITEHKEALPTIDGGTADFSAYPAWEKVAALPDQQIAFSVTDQDSNQQIIRIIDWGSSYRVAKAIIQGSSISAMAAHSDGRLVFNAIDGQTNTLFILNYWHNYLHTIDTRTDGISTTCFASTPDHYLIAGYSDGSVRVFKTDLIN